MSEQPGAQQTEPAAQQRLTHVRGDGSAHMVDVSGKEVTQRVARAQAVVKTTAEVTALLASDGLPKGDALATARIAGIMAAKKTPELIPLCHPLPVAKVTVDLDVDTPASGSVRITTEVKTTSRTGVEIEALTAATVAALTLYDMIKAVDKAAVITDQMVLFKAGGASGEWARTETETR
ncbi:cyclic pyranopterin monophosphate synthase MoaC [Nesterenkonia sp. LB17]|uniref:cyclic pyranopterin monophosphate synthase MoaC n=1 Tax=unclassified Nesterenkonia TaxID=2629769 RepID=UPI001F4D122B|nr:MULTISPECIES: cyclic pyranopterin monophosphate synthase MoaC [unclassified Nesterenkonia]MCH8559626.1 cyclic pyranopterin monophosphate synthase MoaC [Nesterenkonia sp. DZ6]MCH8561805.1 cyclic pyranopterin monophosphate synthase MoaC [Nesterenkonia sp. YGD6]MCH8564666.1 cyclic pyranopterin monophosphate synthase MoaC [Nesterenkonia sp. LB17]